MGLVQNFKSFSPLSVPEYTRTATRRLGIYPQKKKLNKLHNKNRAKITTGKNCTRVLFPRENSMPGHRVVIKIENLVGEIGGH